MVGSVTVGGEFQIYGSTEYYFPVTADDMVKGVVFCDFGTVEEDISVNWNDFRVAPGFGLRLNIPAMGQAPLALDFAFPVSDAITDRKRVFTFNVGIAR
jgi:outer membrane protein insertion porin family